MILLIKIEEGFLFILSIYLFYRTGFSWWLMPLLLMLPDISMAGYVVNNTIGAIVYNLFHHRSIPVTLFLTGSLAAIPVVELAGIILFAHICLDRMFGMGLKYSDSIRHTHLEDI